MMHFRSKCYSIPASTRQLRIFDGPFTFHRADWAGNPQRVGGVIKTFGLLPGAMRGLRFDRRVEVPIADRADIAPIVQPMLAP